MTSFLADLPAQGRWMMTPTNPRFVLHDTEDDMPNTFLTIVAAMFIGGVALVAVHAFADGVARWVKW